MSSDYPKFLLAGEDGLIVEFGDRIDPEVNSLVLRLAEILSESEMAEIVELVPTYCSLFISYNPMITTFSDLVKRVEKVLPLLKSRKEVMHKLVRIPVVYGGEYGPDLVDVAKMHGLTEREVIEIHTGKDYLVYMLGFTPGFPYMGVVPEEIATPRLKNPRLKVPKGSVGIAETQTGIYSMESPGGWRIIGRTPIEVFNPFRKPPFLLSPGDGVRFFPISFNQFEKWAPTADLPQDQKIEKKDGDSFS
jgi:KipI family sensor histidine kinase inhibitor